jgi:hypothetical protein
MKARALSLASGVLSTVGVLAFLAFGRAAERAMPKDGLGDPLQHADLSTMPACRSTLRLPPGRSAYSSHKWQQNPTAAKRSSGLDSCFRLWQLAAGSSES